MSKSKFGNSNLYMTTSEFADLVVEALHEQNYFKHDDVAHPQDIAYAFTTIGETIGNAISWAIKQEADFRKEAVMQPTTLSKNINYTNKHYVGKTYTSNSVLPQDEEIAPSTGGDYDAGYNIHGES